MEKKEPVIQANDLFIWVHELLNLCSQLTIDFDMTKPLLTKPAV